MTGSGCSWLNRNLENDLFIDLINHNCGNPTENENGGTFAFIKDKIVFSLQSVLIFLRHFLYLLETTLI